MFFDHEICHGPLLVRSSDLSRYYPFFGSVRIIAVSHINSQSNLLNQYRMRHGGAFTTDSLSPHNCNKVSADTDSNLDFKTISNDYTPQAGQIKGLLSRT